MSHTSALKIIAYPGRPAAPKRFAPAVDWATAPGRLGAWLREAIRRRQSRRAIAGLDPRMLADIGVSWSDAENEANKPWWLP